MHAENFCGLGVVSVRLLDGSLNQFYLCLLNAVMERADWLSGGGGFFGSTEAAARLCAACRRAPAVQRLTRADDADR